MTQERRRARRWPVAIECSWTRGAVITDISTAGCYIDSRIAPRVGEQVEFTAAIGDHEVQFRGTTVNSTPGVGFGVAFAALPEDAALLLRTLEKA